MIEAELKRAQVVHLRRQGISFRAIASQLGYSLPMAYEAFKVAMAENGADPAEVRALRLLESERLDAAQAAIWHKVMNGNLEAVRVFVRVSERRSKLWGLDAPTKTELSGSVEGLAARLPLAEIDAILRQYDLERSAGAKVVSPSEGEAAG